jgi:predicted ArsR family transcriptional regulator
VRSINDEHSALAVQAASAVLRGVSGEASYLERLAIVYSHPVRLRIVTQLFMEEMSPTRYFQKFGDQESGSVQQIHRHFKKLEEHGWLRLVRRRRDSETGRPTDVYRSTELAVFDDDAWAELPYSIRASFTSRTFHQLEDRIASAVQAKTFDSRPDRHLSWIPVVLDEEGWRESIAGINRLFSALTQEQIDAKIRLAESEETSILATVALAGFESPGPGHQASTGNHSTKSVHEPVLNDVPASFTTRLSRLFKDPLNLMLVTELNLRAMSATQLHKEFDIQMSVVLGRLERLEDLGWIERVGEKTGGKRRGGTEVFYQATGPAYFDGKSWAGLPDEDKSSATATTINQLFERVAQASEARTLDARLDRHVSWSLLLLDERGWTQVMLAIKSYFHALFLIQRKAKERIQTSDPNSLVATFVLAGFETPPGDAEVWS